MVLAAIGMTAVLMAVGAQEPAQERERDPQARYEPGSGPGVGQGFLARFAGEWDVVKTFHPREGEPVRLGGTCRQEMVQGGRFLRSDFRFGEGEAATTGMGLIGYEPEPGVFTSAWIDSRATRFSIRRSRGPFDGRAIVLDSESLDDGPAARTSRTVTTIEDDDRTIVHRQYVPTPEGAEHLIMELRMTRRGPSPGGDGEGANGR